MNTYIYKLILVDRLFTRENWTKPDEDIIMRHVAHLRQLLQDGRLVIAGKTAELSPDTYGIVICTASDYAEAQKIINSDPGVDEGIMTGYLQEYSVAFFNKEFKKE